jgi:hypothetical protein
MQGLLPIIRRKRRPLIVADAPPVAAVDVEPVPVSHEEAQMARAAGEKRPTPAGEEEGD